MEAQSQTGVKYIIWGVLGVIAILVTVKQLGFNPTKIAVPGASVELSGGLAPQRTQQGDPPPAQNTAQLESRVHELESQLSSKPSQTRNQSSVYSQTPEEELRQAQIGGTWVGPYTMLIKQNGSSFVVQVYNYQLLAAVGNGTLNGRNLQASYVNNLGIPGTFSGTVSPDDRQLNVTDYGKGFPVPAVYTRSQ